MTPKEAGSVTRMIGELKAGADEAVGKLWERYSGRIVGLARARLKQMAVPRTAADEVDVANSAFDSFCTRAAGGKFPNLEDRDDLWRLVARITARKAIDLREYQRRVKRGGGPPLGSSALAGAEYEEGADPLGQIAGSDPTPEFAAMMAEECRRLLDALGDETLRQVALWKVDGYTNKEIAGHLQCAPRTVIRKLNLIREKWAGELPYGRERLTTS